MSKVRTSDYFDDSVGNRQGFLRMLRSGEGDSAYWTGDYVHPLGIVSVYRDYRFTRLDFAAHDRLYMRSWRTHFADRTLHRLSRDFVTDILSDVSPNA